MSFQFDFTVEKFQQIVSNNHSADWYAAIYATLPLYNIDTQQRVAAFLSQTCVESNDYNLLVENLNYTAEQLLRVWPYYFKTADQANAYAHQPEKIANYVYSNRLGNGTESSGDGWKYRGRGIIQITGKNNYLAESKTLFGDTRLLTQPELLTTYDIAVKSACIFWNSKNLNDYADQGDTEQITYLINGGYTDLQQRKDKYDLAMAVL
jgi:putative chitinase